VITITEKPTIANIAVTNPAFSTLEAAAIQGVAVVLVTKLLVFRKLCVPTNDALQD
jgi:hypothetical protein